MVGIELLKGLCKGIEGAYVGLIYHYGLICFYFYFFFENGKGLFYVMMSTGYL